MTPFNLCCLAIVFVENRHDLIKPDSAGLHRALDKADNLFKSGEYRWDILFLTKHVLLFLPSGFLSGLLIVRNLEKWNGGQCKMQTADCLRTIVFRVRKQ